MISHIYPPVLQAVSSGRGYAGCLDGCFQGYRGEAMQDFGYELPRITIPRTWVNSYPWIGPGYLTPSRAITSSCACRFNGSTVYRRHPSGILVAPTVVRSSEGGTVQKRKRDVIVVIGPGQIGQAIARRVGVGKHVLLADVRQENADAAAEVLGNAGYEVSVATVDASSRDAVHALVETATGLGDVTGLIHAAGVSPTQASPATILKVDLYGTALVLEEFGNVIARGGAGVVIASQSGHRLPPLTVEQDKALAMTPVEELLGLPFLQPDQVTESLHAYQLAKRGNSLRVMAEAVRWGERGARVNTISPGIVMTPLAKDELTGPRGEGYRRMIEGSADGPGRGVHHRQRLPHGRRGERRLLVRRARRSARTAMSVQQSGRAHPAG